MNKYFIGSAIFVCLLLFGWLYVNTTQIADCQMTIREYTEKVDSLACRVDMLEYHIEHQEKQIIVNVNTKNQK